MQGRLTKSSQYALVHSQGRAWANRLVVLKTLPNESDSSRCGFVVSKRVGKAVVRNKVKRRLREIARLTPARPGWDLVFIARRQASNASYQELEAAVRGLLGRARVLENRE